MNDKQIQEQAEINQVRKLFSGAKAEVYFSDEALGVMVFSQRTEDSNQVVMLGFSGKRRKPDYYYRFKSMTEAENFRAKWHDKLMRASESKSMRQAEKAAKRALGHSLQVGDILVASWGYEQTNYDYYQVTRLVGKNSVEIRELSRMVNESEAGAFLLPKKSLKSWVKLRFLGPIISPHTLDF